VIPRFSVEGMAEDLRKKLTIETLKAVLRCEPCFEEFLREKGEKAASEDTIQPPGSTLSQKLKYPPHTIQLKKRGLWGLLRKAVFVGFIRAKPRARVGWIRDPRVIGLKSQLHDRKV